MESLLLTYLIQKEFTNWVHFYPQFWNKLASPQRLLLVSHNDIWFSSIVCCTPATVQEAPNEVESWNTGSFKAPWKVSTLFVSADSDWHDTDSISTSNYWICFLQGPKQGVEIFTIFLPWMSSKPQFVVDVVWMYSHFNFRVLFIFQRLLRSSTVVQEQNEATLSSEKKTWRNILGKSKLSKR